MTRTSLWIALTALLLTGADTAEKAALKDDALLGTWKVVGVTANGETMKEGESFGGKWVVTAEKIKYTIPEPKRDVVIVYLYKLDSSKKPKQIDLKLSETENKITEAEKGTEKGIYSIDGDTLTVCAGGKGRPNDLTAEAGSERLVYTLKKRNSNASGDEQPKGDSFDGK